MAGTDNQITMETNDLQEGSQDTSGNHRLSLRKATSLSRLPTPAGGSLRSPPATPLSGKSPTLSPLSTRAPPVLRSSLLTGPTLIPPPRTKRDSLGLRISPTKVRSHEGSPTGAKSPGFTYNSKKAPAPTPPPRTSPTRPLSSPAAQRPAPVTPERDTGSAGPSSPPVLQRVSSPPISMSSARTTSSSSASSTSPTAPRRPSRDRIRSHSPPSAPVVEKKAPVFQAPPAPSRPPPPPSYELNSRVIKEARQFVNPEVPGYVGFANLPNQVHRKSVKKGFEFTLMVVGESGLGKSTLVNSLFLTDLYPERQLADAADKIEKTVKIDASAVEIEERGVKLRLTVVDTPGFADALNNDDCFKTIISYIDDQFERYLHDESGLNRRHIIDNRVHCCFYFVNPAGHGLKPLDISFMKAVHHKVNIVPVIAKSDTLTRAEVLGLKKKIMKQVEAYGIVLYQLPDCDEDEDEDYKEQCHQLKSAVPFAVVGANQVIEIRGRKVRGRMYPWGVVEVENPEHCDFIKLRTMLITHMQDLQEVTQEIHYENFRSEKLAVSDGVMRKPKTPRTSRVESDREAKMSEKEHALQEKENELKRMQEMLSRMQAEMKQQQNQQQQHVRPKMEAPPPPANRPTHNANGAVNGHPQQAINNNTKPSQTA